MMQKLNDKGQGMAAPPREVSRSAKSTWTGTRAVPSGSAVGLWGRAGALAHSTAVRNRQVSRALGEAAPSRDVFAVFLQPPIPSFIQHEDAERGSLLWEHESNANKSSPNKAEEERCFLVDRATQLGLHQQDVRPGGGKCQAVPHAEAEHQFL